MMRNICFI